jgi:molecular chaperone IbpA
MTKELTLRSIDIPNLQRFGIGFDRMVDEIMRIQSSQNQTNYPPYNIIQYDENRYDIELAVAGFNEGEVEITMEGQLLTISGSRSTDVTPNRQYLVHGIGSRDFDRQFTLADHVEVINASQTNGILVISLERNIPEEKLPKTVAINYKP